LNVNGNKNGLRRFYLTASETNGFILGYDGTQQETAKLHHERERERERKIIREEKVWVVDPIAL